MIILLLAAAAVILFILLPKKTDVEIRIRRRGIHLLVKPRILFGLIPIPIRTKVLFVPPYGFILYSNFFKPKVIGDKKPKADISILNSVIVRELYVTGRIGFHDAPDKSAVAAGAVNIAIIQAVLCLFKIKPAVNIDPDLTGSSFAINVNGIAKFNLGKLVLGSIKAKRRKKDESSNREHNAVVNGAREEAR
ncbi:MAG: hypothetical protein K6F68_03190 [Clostridiales bacterium]|nr:hypothetical protein [Clostridiales bacterium]